MFKTLKMQGLDVKHISMIKSLDRGTRTWKWTHIESQSPGVLGTWSPRVLESWRHEIQSWSPRVQSPHRPGVLQSFTPWSPRHLGSWSLAVLESCCTAVLETPDSLTIEVSEATEVTELVRLLKLLKLLRQLKLVRPLKLVKLLELA